jgi:hypothetical protein
MPVAGRTRSTPVLFVTSAGAIVVHHDYIVIGIFRGMLA